MNASQSLLSNVLWHGMHIPLTWHSSFPDSCHNPMPSWILYNQKASTVNPEKTTVGYLPIIQAPTSDLDTLNKVVQRVLHVAKSMDQQHIVLTVDEAFYPKLLELKWSVEEYIDVLIPCLGGLHISMN